MRKIVVNLSSLLLSMTFLATSCLFTLHHSLKNETNVGRQIRGIKDYKEQVVVAPGQVTLFYFPYFGPFRNEKLICNDTQIQFTKINHSHAMAYLAPSYFLQDAYLCAFRFDEHDGHHVSLISVPFGNITLKKYPYKKEQLTADKSKVHLSRLDQKRVQEETELLRKIFHNPQGVSYDPQAFLLPLDAKITSFYGTQRVFNQSFPTQHLGTDLRARIGTQVKAAHPGLVVFAGELFMGGRTVVVEHGLGVFTTYSHLSELSVAVGDRVTSSSIVGLSGMTGRVNGPHLHWGVTINGNWVDGLSLIEESKKNQLFVDVTQ